MTLELPAGTIDITPRALAQIVVHAARDVAGMAAFARPAAIGDQSPALAWHDAALGVERQPHITPLTLDIFVILEDGTPIAEVVAALQARIQAAVALALHIDDVRINVRIQGIRPAR
ncbi:MAG TPA: Asp23/Gls24 family envelope stress response protein [Roseiflexaceae bacterium]|nr:Asp23/Gls24 family envelope stress response protein [Roseiflexaceae bacterium]